MDDGDLEEERKPDRALEPAMRRAGYADLLGDVGSRARMVSSDHEHADAGTLRFPVAGR